MGLFNWHPIEDYKEKNERNALESAKNKSLSDVYISDAGDERIHLYVCGVELFVLASEDDLSKFAICEDTMMKIIKKLRQGFVEKHKKETTL